MTIIIHFHIILSKNNNIHNNFSIGDIRDQLLDYVYLTWKYHWLFRKFCSQKQHLNCRDDVFIVFLCILPITKYNIIFCKPSAHFYHSVNQCFDRIL